MTAAPIFFKLKVDGKYVDYTGGGLTCLVPEDPGFNNLGSYFIAPSLCKSIMFSQFTIGGAFNPSYVGPDMTLISPTTPPIMELQAAFNCSSMVNITAGQGLYVQHPQVNPNATMTCANVTPVPPNATPAAFEMVQWGPAFKLQSNNGPFLSYDSTKQTFGTSGPDTVFEFLNNQVILSGTFSIDTTGAPKATILTNSGGNVSVSTGTMPATATTASAWNQYQGTLMQGGQGMVLAATGITLASTAPPGTNFVKVVPYLLPDSTQYAVYQIAAAQSKTLANAGVYNFQLPCVKSKKTLSKKDIGFIVGGCVLLVAIIATVVSLGIKFGWFKKASTLK
jgi:hypothetical protein